MGKESAAVKEAPRQADVPTSGDSSNNAGLQGAVHDAWGGFKGFMRKAGETARDTGSVVLDKSKEAVGKGKEFVQSEQGQKLVKQGREGAADVVDAAAGNSNNRTVNEVVRNARILPGAGNVLNAAEALSDSGVTGKIRDGRGTVRQDVLIEGAIKSAPVSGDAARLKHLSDRTGFTDRLFGTFKEKFQQRQEAPEAQTDAQKKDAGKEAKKQEDKDRAHEEQPRARVKR